MLLPYAMAAAEEARTDGSDSNDGNDAFNVDVGWNVVCILVASSRGKNNDNYDDEEPPLGQSDRPACRVGGHC